MQMFNRTAARTPAHLLARTALVESLEGRRLFAATPVSPVLEAGELQVAGTRKADVIVVTVNAPGSVDAASGATYAAGYVTVTVNGVASGPFARELITVGVRVAGGNGNDTISVVDDTAGAAVVGVTMLGGNGKDDLTGGAGADLLEGGNGNDLLRGSGGNDALKGGNGKDALEGGDGDDQLDGGRSKDTMTGGLGIDTFAGRLRKEVVVDFEAGVDVGDIVTGLNGGKGKAARR